MEDAKHGGINCVSLAHLALKSLFDFELPAELGCAEMYLDRQYFKQIDHGVAMRLGDLAWFGIQNAARAPEDIKLEYSRDGTLTNWRDFPVKHVAVYTGITQQAVPLFLHATFLEGGKNAVWPLPKFQQYARYRKFYGITRLAVRGEVAYCK